ncbi:MAG: 30S ribosomal protein S13 [Patescibacteria group bacterium]|jgi:small subunit ribosomal protein S13
MVLRISGIILPNEKRIEVALTAIFGIGLTSANKILVEAGVDPNTRVKDLKEDEANKIRLVAEKNYRIEGDLRREIMTNIKRLKDIGSYRGSRHAKHLPLRGQRTRTNTRTVRGNVRKTMGSGRKISAQKT